jgi:hypothetical protein
MDVLGDWETWLEVELLDLLGKCADKLEADGIQPDAAGANVAAAARAVINRWDPFLVLAGGETAAEKAAD